MATLVRWSPMREMLNLRQEFDRLFDDAYQMSTRSGNGDGMPWGLALDITEDDNAFTVKASVPGISADDLDITLTDNVLTIAGEFRSEMEDESKQYHLRERRFGRFSRSVTLPVPVVADDIEANYNDGVLTLEIPKAEEVKPRRIAIKGMKNQRQALEGKVS